MRKYIHIKFLLSLLIGLLGYWSIGLFFAPQAHAALPVNFQRNLIIGSGLTQATGFGIAPDGRIFILERSGTILIYKNGSLLSTPFATLPSAASGDRGLIGVAFDPNFLQNHWVYFYYTDANTLHNKLVRFDASNDVGANGPVILYETQDQSEELHVGGTIMFGPDGKLWLSVGDNGYHPNAQDLSNPHGKILRLNPDGTIPADNPFYGQAGKAGEIWAYGFRNPFRFNFDSATGNLYVGDVGEATTEEIDHVVKGGNYGWPNCEGPCSPSNPLYIDPIYSWPHNGGSAAAVGGPVYHGQLFPSDYQGRLFFGDYAQGWIKTMTLDSSGNNTGVYDFDPDSGPVVDMHIDGRDGSLYAITFAGDLYQYIYDTGNTVPTVNLSASATKGQAPLAITFSSSGTSDPDGDTLSYNWDFGDGTSSTDPNPSHQYSKNGTYIVQLKVGDGTYTALGNPITIQVGTPPTVTILSPQDKAQYKAGDTIQYAASATDSLGNTIPDSNFTTTVLFHHQTHIHPFLGPMTSKTGSFTIPVTGEPSSETWYEIQITATDSNGLATTQSVNIYPLTSHISFTTDVGTTIVQGLQILLDGIPTITPDTETGVVGFERIISVPVYQVLNGVYYAFDHWSDNQDVSHMITTAASDTSYTAFFTKAAGFEGDYYNNATLSGSPTLTRHDNAINFTWGNTAPDPSLPQTNFSVRWTGSQYFSAGRYDFTTTTDDGVRLWIDNNLVIDQWHDQGGTSYTATVDLTSGQHAIKMEYYQGYGGAEAVLTWNLSLVQPTPSTSPDPIGTGSGSLTPTPTPTATPSATPTPTDGYQASYWNFGAGEKPDMPTTTPDVTRIDPAINFNWSNTSPDPKINQTHFIAKWTRTASLSAGVYEFTAQSDDGVRVYVDGQLLIDQWTDHAWTKYTAQKTLTSGSHNFEIDYYQDQGGSVAMFDYQPALSPTPTPTPTQETDYTASYWNSGTGEKPDIPITTPTLTRVDKAINYDWGDTASPDPSINHDHFIAVWTATKNFQDGSYTFHTESDDGIRVFIDGQNILDQWTDHAWTVFESQKQMTQGLHTIRIEYYQDSGGAVAKFNYFQSITTPTPTPASNILPSAWHLTATNGVAQDYQQVATTLLEGKSTLSLTYDLHGLCLSGGDASAIVFDQAGSWKMVSLANYGENCFDGTQTVNIPLTDFKDHDTGVQIDLSKPIDGLFHVRFWGNGFFTIDISSAWVQ